MLRYNELRQIIQYVHKKTDTLLLMRNALFLATLASLLFAAPASSSERIIGGTPAKHTGSTVALVEKNTNSYRGYFCAGTLLGPRWVLTARHCLDAFGVREMDVVVGRADLRSHRGKRIAPVRAYYASAEEANYEDVALLYLGERSSASVSRLGSQIPDVGSDVGIRGWGAMRSHYPRTLQETEVEIQSNSICHEAYSWTFSSADMLCAGSRGRDACWGDSGGALSFRGKVIGVVSFGGLRCAEEGYPTAYAKIPGWVRHRLQNPPHRYKQLLPGKDTRREPRPFILLQHILQGNTATDDYELYISAYSNFRIIRAKARLRGPEDMFFCQEDGCVSSNQWFEVPLGDGRRHADIFFPEGNKECPIIETFVETEHPDRRYLRDTSSVC